MKMRWAVSRSSTDRFPVMFRNNCERTPFDSNTGEDESLIQVMERLNKQGYDLLHTRSQLEEWLIKKGLGYLVFEPGSK